MYYLSHKSKFLILKLWRRDITYRCDNRRIDTNRTQCMEYYIGDIGEILTCGDWADKNVAFLHFQVITKAVMQLTNYYIINFEE